MLNIRRAIKTISKRLIRSYCEKHEKKKQIAKVSSNKAHDYLH